MKIGNAIIHPYYGLHMKNNKHLHDCIRNKIDISLKNKLEDILTTIAFRFDVQFEIGIKRYENWE